MKNHFWVVGSLLVLLLLSITVSGSDFKLDKIKSDKIDKLDKIKSGDGLVKVVNDSAMLDGSCYYINSSWVEQEYVVEWVVFKDNKSEGFDVVGSKDVVKSRLDKYCDSNIRVGVEWVDYESQGFNCSFVEGFKDKSFGSKFLLKDVFVCDSVRDGNGDGVCRVGETCCVVDSWSGESVCSGGFVVDGLKVKG